jgi:hypothetical protein
MINYNIQEKLVKPTAKSCMWCKHSNIFGLYDNYTTCDISEKIKVNSRMDLKFFKEEDFRYCKSYIFSKDNFKAWKNERKINSRRMFGGY